MVDTHKRPQAPRLAVQTLCRALARRSSGGQPAQCPLGAPVPVPVVQPAAVAAAAASIRQTDGRADGLVKQSVPGSKRCGYTVHAPMRTCNSHSASAPPGRGSTISGSSSSCCLLSLHCSLLSTLWLLLNLSVFLRVPFILRLQLLHQLRSMRALATYLRNMTCPAGDGVHPWSGLHSHMAPWSLHRSWKQRSVLKASSHRAFIATSTRQQSRVQHA